jgi:tetratricopeptide (TPR) repeat protein
MKRTVILVLVLLMAGATVALAATKSPKGKGKSDGGGVTVTPSTPAGGVTVTPSGGAAAPAAGSSEEARRVAEIQALLTAGDFAKAIDAANTFLKTAKDENAKTDAVRIIADSYRKKGDWRMATGAYQRLRDRYPKGADDWIRSDAIAEVLRASPTGVYTAGAAGAAKGAASGGAATALSDDGALAEALARLAGFRGAKLKARVATIRRGTTPQQVMAAFSPAVDDAKQMFTLSPDAPSDAARETTLAAGTRMQELGTQIITALKAKLEGYQPKMRSPWSFTNIEKTDIKNAQTACKEMVEAEKNFQESIFTMAGKGDWPDADRLRKESTDRRAAYEEMSNKYVVPEYYTIYGY